MGINPQTETGWVSYCIGLVIFNLLGLLLVFVIQKFQFYLPFNPQEFSGVSTVHRLIRPSVSSPIPTGRAIVVNRR